MATLKVNIHHEVEVAELNRNHGRRSGKGVTTFSIAPRPREGRNAPSPPLRRLAATPFTYEPTPSHLFHCMFTSEPHAAYTRALN